MRKIPKLSSRPRCERCLLSHKLCDGQKPTCTFCKNGSRGPRTCVYPEGQPSRAEMKRRRQQREKDDDTSAAAAAKKKKEEETEKAVEEKIAALAAEDDEDVPKTTKKLKMPDFETMFAALKAADEWVLRESERRAMGEVGDEETVRESIEGRDEDVKGKSVAANVDAASETSSDGVIPKITLDTIAGNLADSFLLNIAHLPKVEGGPLDGLPDFTKAESKAPTDPVQIWREKKLIEDLEREQKRLEELGLTGAELFMALDNYQSPWETPFDFPGMPGSSRKSDK